ncbi:vWA domain-containing protein [Reyranella massiliensis]|uniref:vWA domain-containing protein n=1 Tax=Reyranella massiliensis TaxID=445220 RepID=UPI0002E230FD|nr:VWA domain-containing protein [Reyranella massiliensis]
MAQAPDGARVFLVLDASGSMWGRVGNQTKIEVARETIRSLLKDWRPQDQLGLVTYGHRRKGDCGDIEVLRQVGPVDADALMAQVNGISPKGMTPMTASVKMAAEQLKSTEGLTSVILVSDGVETCKADPCSVAAELKKADVKLVVHTVGFDIQDRQAAKQLECMAAATGGLALSAGNAGELSKAIGQAVEAARQKASATPPPPPKAELKPEWNLEGSARLAEGDDPLVGKDFIVWVFYKPMPAGVEPEYVQTSNNSLIETEIAPGDYLVEVSIGSVKRRASVKVEPAKMNRLDVVLNAGRLALRAKRTADENQKGDVFWEVVSKSNGSTVFNSFDPETSTIVAADKYTVTMTLGGAKVEREVEVIAGDTTAVEIVAGVGRMQGSIVFAKGGPALRDPFIEIFAGAEPVENETSVTNAYGSAPKFDLAAGAYRARITSDAIDRTFKFEIKAGQRLDIEFALDAGIAAFEAPGVDTIEIKGAGRDIYGERTNVTTLYEPFKNFELPAGKYVVVAIKGDARKEAEFEIVAGQRTVTRMTLP